MAEESARKPTRIRSVDRAARLLLLLASDPSAAWRVRALAARMRTSVPTMYHLLNTLSDVGFITVDEQGNYCLGIAVGNLAAAYHEQSLPPPELLVPLRTISDETGESAYLSAWRNGQMEVIAHRPGTLAVRVNDLRAGFHGVAHARAAGKVLLAFGTEAQLSRYLATSPLDRVTDKTVSTLDGLLAELDEARVNGYGVEYEEFAEGVGCLSVPILGRLSLLGAFTVTAPVDRLRSQFKPYLGVLVAAARTAAERVDQMTDFEPKDTALDES